MDELVPGVARFRNRHIRTEPETEPLDNTWRTGQAGVQVKSVCEQCNSGWMDRLDHEAEELFCTMAARGDATVVADPLDRYTIARWCVLIAILCDQGQAQPRIGHETLAQLYAGKMPSGVRVWLARTEPPLSDPDVPDAEITIADMDLESDDLAGHAYFVTFRVQHLVVQVFVPTKRTPEGIQFARVANERLIRQLWPDTLTPLVWPPNETLAWGDYDAFTRAFRYRSR